MLMVASILQFSGGKCLLDNDGKAFSSAALESSLTDHVQDDGHKEQDGDCGHDEQDGDGHLGGQGGHGDGGGGGHLDLRHLRAGMR